MGSSENAAKDSSEDENSVRSFEPHILWIDFVYEWLEWGKNSSPNTLNIVVSMLNRALYVPDKLTRNTVTLCARFKLLVVALKLCQIRLGLNHFVKYL